MKDLLLYYKASNKNKVRVYLAVILGYLVVYLIANPYTYSSHIFRAKMAIKSAATSVSQVFTKQNNSPVKK